MCVCVAIHPPDPTMTMHVDVRVAGAHDGKQNKAHEHTHTNTATKYTIKNAHVHVAARTKLPCPRQTDRPTLHKKAQHAERHGRRRDIRANRSAFAAGRRLAFCGIRRRERFDGKLGWRMRMHTLGMYFPFGWYAWAG